jgi:hypothetical protein
MTAMPKISRRRFSHLVLGLLGAAALPRAALAFGGPSGAKTLYPVQGHLGELIMNPYRIAPLTAIIRNGGYEVRRAHVRIVPKEGGQEIAYDVSDAQVLTHGGIPVFGLYPDWVNKVEVSYDRIFAGKTEHFNETYSMYAPPVVFKLSGVVETKSNSPKIEVKKRSANSPTASTTSTTSRPTTTTRAMPSGTTLRAARCSGPTTRSTSSSTPAARSAGTSSPIRSWTSTRSITAAS